MRTRPVTMQDVADLAGVSSKTVSNVVNNRPHISPAMREKVERAVAELGYRANLTARNLRRGRTGMIGLAIPELSQPYFAELADQVIAYAKTKGVSVLVEPTIDSPDGDAGILVDDRRLLSDGLILSPNHLTPGGPRLDSLGIPVVVLTERLFETGVDHITMQDTAAAQAATAYLLDQGRRRIAAIGAQPLETVGTAMLRERGYRAAHAARDVAVDPTLMEAVDRWQPDGGFRAMEAILDRGAAPDAVFAFNDSMAVGAMRALSARGIAVPQDVAVVGFDDITAARFTEPPLTTIAPGRAQAARLAVDLLLARIDGSRTVPGEEILTDFELVVRGSA